MDKTVYSDAQLQELFDRRESTLTSTLKVQRGHAQLFEYFNLSRTEYRVIAFLLFHPNSEPSAMAEALMVLRQTMTKVVDSLEHRGYAVRSLNINDRRRLCIKLTPEGEALARRILSIESDYYYRVRELISDEEMQKYRALTNKVQSTRNQVMEDILDNLEETPVSK